MIYTSINKKFSESFFSFTEKANKILISSHISPDDDAIGSALGLQSLLRKLYPKKQVDIAISGYPSDRFSCFEGYDSITFNQDISQLVNNYKLLILLDGNEYQRFSSFPEILKATNVPKICLDHHSSHADNFSLYLQNTKAASTSDLIFKLAEKKISLDIIFCESILLGILGDTGTFNYIKPGQYYLFDIVKKILIASQINIQEFKSKYMSIQPESFEVIKELTKNSQYIAVKNWPDLQVSYLTKEFVDNNRYDDSQISEGSNIFVSQYIRQIKNYTWGFVITPRSDKTCHFSFRSLPGSINVRDLVERMGIGGGHDRASGAKLSIEDPKKALDFIIDWMNNNLPLLQ